jgi:hypothetical protein
VTHPLEWQEFHTHLMRLAGPDVNYIEASENFANLEAAMEYYRDHDNEAEEIARNSYETFARRYLTPAAVSLLRSNISTCRLTIDRLRATGDDFSGLGLRCKAMSQSCIHPTSTATWLCEQHRGRHSQPTGPTTLRLSLRHLNRLAGFKFQKTTIRVRRYPNYTTD